MTTTIGKKLAGIFNRVEFYALIVFIVNLPFALTPIFDSLIYRICIIIFISTLILSGRILQISKIRFYPTLCAMIALVIAYAVGLIYTANLKSGLFQLERSATLLILPLLLSTSSIRKAQFRTLLYVFAWSVTFAAVICLVYAFYRDSYSLGGVNWLFFTYYDLTDILKIQPNYLALYCCFAIAFLLHAAFIDTVTPHRLKIALYLSVALYLGVFVLLCSGRTQILALLIFIVVFTMYMAYRQRKFWVGVTATSSLAVITIFAIMNIPVAKERFMQAFNKNENAEWTKMYGNTVQKDVRQLKWIASSEILREHWLLGVGTGDVQDKLQIEYARINFIEAFNAKFNAHNQYIQTTLAIGITGFLLIIACFFFAARDAWRASELLYLSFIALVAMCCMTESIFERQFGVTFFAVFNSLFAVTSRKPERL